MSFPGVYMFKFIIKCDNRKIALIRNVFGEDAEVHTKESSGGKYISITATQVVMSVEEIIGIYKKVEQFEGVIWL